ncbi:MAG: EamA family transporter [Anaerolineales bacterium]|nr:EamA family transporter [Anaerolineales bacterium]
MKGIIRDSYNIGMHPTARSARLSLLEIHLAVLLAGGAGLFAKFVPVSPAVLTAGRTLFGSLTLLLFALLIKASLRPRRPRDLFVMLLAGAILAAHWFTFFLSIQVSTVAIGLLAFSTFPLFVTFLEPLVFRERLHGRDIVMAIVVVAGLMLVTPSFDVTNTLTQGLLWGVLSAFTFAVLALLNRAYVRAYPPVTVSFYQQAFAFVCMAPFALQWDGALTGQDWLMLVILGIVFTALGQGLIVASLRHLRAQTASVIFGLEPVYGILLAWLLLGEVPALRTLLGGAIILGAVLWASLQHRSSKPIEISTG